MRILLSIHHALDPDTGAPGATLALGSALAELGNEVRYASFDDLPDRLPAVGKEALFPVLGGLAIERETRSWRPHVVDASTGDAWLWATVRRRRRPALVTRSHGLEHRFWSARVGDAARRDERLPARTRLYHGGFRLWEVERSLRAADLALVLNAEDRSYLLTGLELDAERVRVVSNGVDAELLAPTPPPGEPARGIAVIGAYSDRKGRAVLAEALSRVLERRPEVEISLLGTLRPAGDVLRDFAPGVRTRVKVRERFSRRELPALVEDHQIYVSASLAEGFPLAMLEAMALGLAPVVTALPAAREVLRDGESAALVPPGDAEALATAVERVVEDASLRDRLRAAARATAERYSWSRIARDTLQLYEEALSVRSSSRPP